MQLLSTLIVLYAIAFGSLASADDQGATPSVTVPIVEGSTLTHRAQVDGAAGQVYIYVGGSFPAGTNLVDLQFLFDFNNAGNTTGYITPLLFYRSPGELFETYTVVGIGKGFEVAMNPFPQAIPFDLVDGVKVPTSDGTFTFGYVNALVNSSGTPLVISPGTIDYDNPGDGGQGLGGALTKNDWAATSVQFTSPVVALGTTFSAGVGTDYTFVPYGSTVIRTYSALAIGTLVAR